MNNQQKINECIAMLQQSSRKIQQALKVLPQKQKNRPVLTLSFKAIDRCIDHLITHVKASIDD